jgi:predicted enzyme related to lactoylglutathione lyase
MSPINLVRKKERVMLQGLTTVNLISDDVPATVAWYSELLGVQPYFVRPEQGPPAYAEFRLGPDEDELGIIDRRFTRHATTNGPAGVVVYWHVDDVEAAVELAVALGASVHDPVTVRGDAGFVTATIVDPFGNVLGLMRSPHWLAGHQ